MNSTWAFTTNKFLVIFTGATPIKTNKFLILRNSSSIPTQRDITIGPCVLVLTRTCPDPDVRFYLFTRRNPNVRQLIVFGSTPEESNITRSNFDVTLPTKVIIHGYNSDMYLGPLIDMRGGLFFIDDIRESYIINYGIYIETKVLQIIII